MASNIITMTRGDTYSFDVTIFDEWDVTKRFTIEDSDRIYFGLMLPHQKFEDAIVKKIWKGIDLLKTTKQMGRLSIRLAPEDTIDLEPGVYYYAIKLKTTTVDLETLKKQIDVVTIVNKTKFIIND